jgi:chemotaxis protein MotB
MTDAPKDGDEDTPHHELVIIRRRSDGEEAPHKGGVWKIAHADFMTALMAFFLVMWLINATDEKTVTGVANYFNPMRLSDSTTKPKGIFTMEPGGDSERTEKQQKKPAKSQDKPTAEKQPPAKEGEAALFTDPYETLDKIAAQAKEAPAAPPASEKAGGPAQRGGQAFRDPFNPDFQGQPLPQRNNAAEPPKENGANTTIAKNGNGEIDGPQSQAGPETPKDKAGGATVDAQTPQGEGEGVSPTTADGGSGTQDLPRKAPTDRSDDAKSEGAALGGQIEALLAQSGFSAVPGVDVRATDEGLLISITDQYDFEMFGIASAKPKPELVVLMEKIGEILTERPEQIVVRGHTDGRPFRSKDYDNWRLSTARAQMANYMLVRSGIPEERIDHIEGHADHDLRVQGDPLAAANRRIEILLEKGKP